jgi:hypothetical protein
VNCGVQKCSHIFNKHGHLRWPNLGEPPEPSSHESFLI